MLAAVLGLLVDAPLAAQEATTYATTYIDPLSVTSLLLVSMSNNLPLASATGFVVQKGDKYYLVTNWHVVTNRRPDNGALLDPQGRTPTAIRIFHNTKDHLGSWTWIEENLIDSTSHTPRWVEHPLLKQGVDLVMLPLDKTEGVAFYPLNLDLRNVNIKLIPAGEVSIVGFPFGNSSGAGLPIWKAGAIASDPDVDYGNSPQMLVDTTSRPGMSGSPVYARRIGSYSTTQGNLVIGSADKFVGVYAGDIDSNSEVGRVFKASALMEIYAAIK
jgi:hypothetical protein